MVTSSSDPFPEWMEQIRLMQAYATTHGKAPGPEVAIAIADAEGAYEDLRGQEAGATSAAKALRSVATQKIMGVHRMLAEIVRPATPDSIRFSSSDQLPYKAQRSRFLVVNYLLALLSFAAYGAGFAFLPPGTQAVGLAHWTWFPLLLGAGGIGASFYNLYSIHSFLVERTFDAQYRNTYYIRWALGVVAGVVLGQVILPWAAQGVPSASVPISPSVAAAVGGFAADAVNDILLRVTDTVKTLIGGRGQAAVAQQQAAVEAEVSRAKTLSQVQSTRALVTLLEEAKSANAPDPVISSIQKRIDETLGVKPEETVH